ncbi:MAG: MFS transporter, partial [Smithellaceae bacterium]|nr:MFS transporter [Smithellaceae bacterium]
PSVAGVLIALVGEGVCFLLNGVSYIAVIAALLAMKIVPAVHPSGGEKNILAEIKEGMIYAYNFKAIRYTLMLMALTSLLGASYAVLMPAFAHDILRGGSHTLGFLMSASGAGAMIGAIYLATLRHVRDLHKIIPRAVAVFGVGLAALSFSHSLWLSLVLLVASGFGLMAQVASTNTLLQTVVDDDKRGRVMSFFTLSFIGMAPFGSLMAGGLAGIIGVPYTLLIGGLCCTLGAFLYLRKTAHVQEALETTR